MVVRETANMPRIIVSCQLWPQIRMAFRAGQITGGGNVDAAAVLDVTCRASRRRNLRKMMSRPVMAIKAGAVGRLRGKRPGLQNVAGRAFFFENGVGFGHPAARVNAMVA